MFVIRNKTFFIWFTVFLMAVSLLALWRTGMKLGIDFTGGSLLEVNYPGDERPDTALVQERLASLGIGAVVVQTTGDRGLIIRARTLTEPERQAVMGMLSQVSPDVTLARFDSIGPVIGSELKQKSLWAIGLVILLIVLYITFAFRKVSHPIASSRYGLIAVVTLLHDVALPTGLYAATGHEFDVLFVTAILAVLGFSVHDTIVVFDRIRENLKVAGKGETFHDTVGKSLSQTVTRSINTSLTVVLVLLALYLLGGVSTENFALVLLVGIIAGTYSSICFASPLLVYLYEWQSHRK